MYCNRSNTRPTWSGLLLFAALSFAATACGDSEGPTDTGVVTDTGPRPDSGGPIDTGIHPDAGGPNDTGIFPDAQVDSGTPVDSGVDAGPTDTGTTATDGGMTDGGGLDGSVTSSCGDDLAEAAEVCDGTDLRNTTCESLGYQAGTLACANDCSTFILAGCPGAPVCGDDTAEGNEPCDGTDLRGFTCISLGFESGTLACEANCTLDTSACVAPAGCGNGIIEGEEVCDDGNVNPGDGCSGGCGAEPPYNCAGQPSNCLLGPSLGTLTIGGTLSTTGGPLADGAFYFYQLTVAEDLLIDGSLINAVTSTTGDLDFGVLFNDGSGWAFVFTSVTEGLGAAGNEIFLSGLIPAGDYAVIVANFGGSGAVPSYSLTLTGVERVVPANWTCDPVYYADGACDCGCGAQDADCANSTDPGICEYCEVCSGSFFADCTLWVDPADLTQCVVPVCGNGTQEATEECDDGNTAPGDGCSDTCTNEGPVGWTCDPAWFDDTFCDCGCGIPDAACADATVASCDFCNNTGSCNLGVGCPGTIDPVDNAICVTFVCGDGTVDPGEDCDDGNTAPGDGCSDTCTVEPTCGDGNVGAGEQCDDGNTAPGDGCDANCQLEAGDIDVSASPALAIPDNDPNGVTTTLNVPAAPACVLAFTRVPVDITHTYRGDLIVELTSPVGTTVRLHDETGGSLDNVVGVYGVDLTPAEDLTAFAGQDPAGAWTLFVSDNAAQDTGTLNSWGLTLLCQ